MVGLSMITVLPQIQKECDCAMVSNRRGALVVLAIIAVIGVFYLSTIREGHAWGGDFSMYIHHAKNIAEGIDYKDTGYIYNPFYPSLGPKTYPPIFPLLLSPIYKCFGLNLTAMKIEIILIFLVSLFMVFWTFRNELHFQYLVAMIAVIGFNPYFWYFKDNVLSDIPFLLWVYLSLFFIHQASQSSKSQRAQLLYAILIGLFICISYGTRSIGLVLIPCLLIYDIIRSKRPTQLAIIATLLFVFLMVLQTIFLHSDSSYFDQFAINPKVIFRNLFLYAKSLSALWDNGYSEVLRGALFVTVCALAITGYLARIKDRITIFEIFLLLYVVPVIVWPSQGARSLIPVIPLYIFYALVGIKRTNFPRHKEIERSVFITLVVVIFVSYMGKYTTIDYGPIQDGIAKKETIELFDYIKEETNEKDVFIFAKPRVLSLFTGRRASVYHHTQDPKDLWDYFYEINATYIIVAWDREELRPLIESYRDSLQEVYSNSDFGVYRIQQDPSQPNDG